MITFLNEKYASIGPKKYALVGPLICFISDVILIYYINNIYIEQALTIKALAPAFALQGIDVHQLPQYELENFLAGAKKMTSFIFWIILLYNSVIYAIAMKGFNWAKKYVRGYALTGAVLSVLEILAIILSNRMINFYIFITTLLYIIAYLGFRYFKKIEEQ